MPSIFKVEKFKRQGEYPRVTDNYIRYRQEDTKFFDPSTFRNVPLSHTKEFKGKKMFIKKYKIKYLKAVVGKSIQTGQWRTQSVLIPRDIYDIPAGRRR